MINRLLILVIFLCLLPMTVFSDQGVTYAGVSVNASVGAEYATLVIMGDNQLESRDCRQGGTSPTTLRCADFQAELEWIEDNAAAENIAGVLFVGDLIDVGTTLPPGRFGGSASACDNENFYTDGTYAVASTGGGYTSSCNGYTGGVAATCEAYLFGTGLGCYLYSNGDCLTCARNEVIKDEWDAFELMISTYLPNVPWAAVKGNHDNAGDQYATDDDREPEGYDQRFDSTYWQGRDDPGSGYEHVASYSGSGGDGHAWKMRLSAQGVDQDIIVVAAPLNDDGTITAAASSWVQDTFANYESLPGVLLSHWYGRGTWPATTPYTDIPNLFAIATGHVYAGHVQNDLISDGDVADSIIRVTNDWTSNTDVDTNAVARNDYMTLIRWYPIDGEVEVKNWSREGQAFMDASAFFTKNSRSGEVAKQAFDIMPPALFDLSPYSTEIAASLGTHTWPTHPTITSTTTISSGGTCAATGFTTAATAGGEHIIVETGVNLTSCNVTLASNTWVEMQGTATIAGNLQGGTNDKIKITGGEVNATGEISMSGDDIIVKNVVWNNSNVGTNIRIGLSTSRHAYVNNTFRTQSYTIALFNAMPLDASCPTDEGTQPSRTDISVIANDIECGLTIDEACLRFQSSARSLIAANHITNDQPKEPIRFYAYQNNGLVIDNILDEDTNSITFQSKSGQCGTISNMHAIDNRMFNLGTDGGVDAQAGTDSNSQSCNTVYFNGNERITNPGGSFTIAPGDCTVDETPANSAFDIDLSPYGDGSEGSGVVPTCSTDYGRTALGCGADH